jgi:hypothetical protein
MDLEGSGRVEIEVLQPWNLSEGTEENYGNRIVVAGVPAEIRVQHLLNTSPERSRLARLLDREQTAHASVWWQLRTRLLRRVGCSSRATLTLSVT